MKTIYIDSDFKCHIVDDGTMTAVQTDAFDGKCNEYIEGCCYESTDGHTKIYSWKPYSELDNAQRKYEQQLLSEYEVLINDLYAEVTAE